MIIKENSHMGTEISRADTLPLTYKLCFQPHRNPSTWDSEAVKSLSVRPAWST